MLHIHSSRSAAAVLLLVLAGLALAACGGSSTKSTSSTVTNASATNPTAGAARPGEPGRPGGPGGGRFSALRECMSKQGITLPKRARSRTPGIGGFLGAGGAPQLPAGVTRAQYEAALKKCGGPFARRRYPGSTAPFSSPVAKEALAKFAACMRSNGANLPEPNTSGKGPIFNTKGLNTSSPAFKAAETKCRSLLLSAFRARPGAGGGTTTG